MQISFPNLPSPSEIQKDIESTLELVGLYKSNIGSQRSAIRTLRREQKKLRVLLGDPGPYDTDALQRNINKLDDDIVRIRATINAEQNKINYFKETILPELYDRKERSEAAEKIRKVSQDDGQNGHRS